MKSRRWLALALIVGGALTAGQGLWIQAKAALAQQLLEQAWQKTLEDGGVHKPWPWADHWPVARLTLVDLKRSYIVLEGDSGNVLAFAPGHNPQSGLLQDDRTSVISGHRDTHFSALRELAIGHNVRLQTPQQSAEFVVRSRRVADTRQHNIAIEADRRLVLVTCWPFDALATSGPLRLVVDAEPVKLSHLRPPTQNTSI